jgi:hypothetical protein
VWDLRFSQKWLWRDWSSGMWWHVIWYFPIWHVMACNLVLTLQRKLQTLSFNRRMTMEGTC